MSVFLAKQFNNNKKPLSIHPATVTTNDNSSGKKFALFFQIDTKEEMREKSREEQVIKEWWVFGREVGNVVIICLFFEEYWLTPYPPPFKSANIFGHIPFFLFLCWWQRWWWKCIFNNIGFATPDFMISIEMLFYDLACFYRVANKVEFWY